MSLATGPVSRPKSIGESGSAPSAGRAAFNFRLSIAYREWLNEVASRERCSASDVFDKAMEVFAEKRGYSLPPRRLAR